MFSFYSLISCIFFVSPTKPEQLHRQNPCFAPSRRKNLNPCPCWSVEELSWLMWIRCVNFFYSSVRWYETWYETWYEVRNVVRNVVGKVGHVCWICPFRPLRCCSTRSSMRICKSYRLSWQLWFRIWLLRLSGAFREKIKLTEVARRGIGVSGMTEKAKFRVWLSCGLTSPTPTFLFQPQEQNSSWNVKTKTRKNF